MPTAEPYPCRPGCGACCIAPSISTPLPGLPQGKPAGMACPHLTPDRLCALWGHPDRPGCCGGLQPARDMCGHGAPEPNQAALAWLTRLEQLTRP